MDIIITWLVVGLVAGALASMLMGGSGFGFIGDILLGIVGAFVGGWTFRELKWDIPFDGIVGVIAVAFVGAVLILALMRVYSSASRRKSRRR